ETSMRAARGGLRGCRSRSAQIRFSGHSNTKIVRWNHCIENSMHARHNRQTLPRSPPRFPPPGAGDAPRSPLPARRRRVAFSPLPSAGEGLGVRGLSPFSTLPRQRPITDPMRLVGVDSQTLSPIRLIDLVRPFAPRDLAVPLESQNVRRDPVQEPAI